MISRGIAGIIGAGVGVIILFFVMTSSGVLQQPTLEQRELVLQDVKLNLQRVEIVSVDDEMATIEVEFDAFNPNQSSVVLESIRYNLYADGIRVAASEIGERPEGFIAGAGKTFTMYREFTLTLKDTVEVRNSELLTSIWQKLKDDNVQWRVSGTFFVTDPVRAGGQELDFDFTT